MPRIKTTFKGKQIDRKEEKVLIAQQMYLDL